MRGKGEATVPSKCWDWKSQNVTSAASANIQRGWRCWKYKIVLFCNPKSWEISPLTFAWKEDRFFLFACLFCFFWLCCLAYRILVFDKSNLHPLQWNHGDLTTGQQGKCLLLFLMVKIVSFMLYVFYHNKKVVQLLLCSLGILSCVVRKPRPALAETSQGEVSPLHHMERCPLCNEVSPQWAPLRSQPPTSINHQGVS